MPIYLSWIAAMTDQSGCMPRLICIFAGHTYYVGPCRVAQSLGVNVSECRYVSNCRSRGHKFDPVPFTYFCGEFLEPFSSLPLIQEGLISVTSESMCTKYWLTA